MRSGSLTLVTLAEIARALGGDIHGDALRTTIDGVLVEVLRTHSPMTHTVAFQTRVFLDARIIDLPFVRPDEFAWMDHPALPLPELPNHIFGGSNAQVLHALSLGDATVDDVCVTVSILVGIAKALPVVTHAC